MISNRICFLLMFSLFYSVTNSEAQLDVNCLPMQMPVNYGIQPQPNPLIVPYQPNANPGMGSSPFAQPQYVNERVIYYPVPYPYVGPNSQMKENGRKPDGSNNSKIPQKPNKCPPEKKRSCFKSTPYKRCETDMDCEEAYKCCFDYCLEQSVCKPPVYV